MKTSLGFNQGDLWLPIRGKVPGTSKHKVRFLVPLATGVEMKLCDLGRFFGFAGYFKTLLAIITN